MTEEIKNKIKEWVEKNKYNMILREDSRGNIYTGDFIRIIEFYEFLNNL